jgi:hypothetical protein
LCASVAVVVAVLGAPNSVGGFRRCRH